MELGPARVHADFESLLFKLPPLYPPRTLVLESFAVPYQPNDVQKHELQIYRAAARSLVKEISRRIALYLPLVDPSIRGNVHAQMQERQNGVREHVALTNLILCPVLRLPDEVMSEICIAASPSDVRNDTSAARKWDHGCLMLVCHRWHGVAHQTRSMWTHLFMVCDYDVWKRFAIRGLKRSCGATLTVFWTDASSLLSSLGRHLVRGSASLLRTECTRIVSLHLRLSCLFHPQFSTAVHLSFSEMRSLKLEACHSNKTIHPIGCQARCFRLLNDSSFTVPKLCFLTVNNPILLQQIKDCEPLRNLELVIPGSSTFGEPHFKDFRKAMVCLSPETFRIDHWLSKESRDLPAKWDLPRALRIHLLAAYSLEKSLVWESLLSLELLQTRYLDDQYYAAIHSLPRLRCLSFVPITQGEYGTVINQSVYLTDSPLLTALHLVSQFDLGPIQWDKKRWSSFLHLIHRRICVPNFRSEREDTRRECSAPLSLRLDCISVGRNDSFANTGGFSEMNALMKGWGYRLLSEEYCGRSFWVHTEFHETPTMWEVQS